MLLLIAGAKVQQIFGMRKDCYRKIIQAGVFSKRNNTGLGGGIACINL